MKKTEMLDFVRFLVENGYSDIVLSDDGRYAALMRLMFTTAIVIGKIGDRDSYYDRWCYHDEEHARAALRSWEAADMTGEPSGWHRHPRTGRRRTVDGDEYVNP